METKLPSMVWSEKFPHWEKSRFKSSILTFGFQIFWEPKFVVQQFCSPAFQALAASLWSANWWFTIRKLMRVFWFIFSLYLLLLFVQPCPDCAASEFPYPQIENEQTQPQYDREHTESESRECSPFCICSCRQVFVTDKIPVPSSNGTIVCFLNSTARISYQSKYSHQHLKLIWQPQKLISQSS